MTLRDAGVGARFVFTVALLGAGFAYAFSQVWELDVRWFAVVLTGLTAISVAMCLVRVLPDFLMVSTFFCLPIASFAKWFWPSGYADRHGDIVFVGVFGLGILDFTLIGLYAIWACRIFVVRTVPLPRVTALDGLVLWVIMAHLLATIGSRDPELALSATEFFVKNALFYVYVSRHFQGRHLPWLLAALAFTILVETLLGSFQFATGKLLGIALDKGAGGSAVNFEAVVPGTEGYHRATGTSYDAHTLGTLMAMVLPFPFVLSLSPRLPPPLRLACIAGSGMSVLVILMSLSRSAWLGSATGLVAGVFIILIIWRERHLVPALAGGLTLIALMMPFVARFAYERFANSPYGTVSTRLDQYRIAWRVFTEFPAFGIGPGNWINVYQRYDYLWLPNDNSMNLVHNVVLWIAIEIGVFGLVPYLLLLGGVMLRLLNTARARRDVPGRLALACLIALIAFTVTGMTDPAYREPNVFLMFWLHVALSVALPRISPGTTLVHGSLQQRRLE